MRAILVLTGVLLATSAAAQPNKEFSADMVVTPKGGEQHRGKLYFSKGKMRTELGVEGRRAVMIYDFEGEKGWMLMPEQKMAMDLSGAMAGREGQGPQGKELFVRNGDPCAGSERITCTQVGSERVEGRKTEKWRIVEKQGGSVSHLWIDRELSVAIKVESSGSKMVLTNLSEGAQPAALFQVPKGYQIMQVPGMGPGGMPPGMGPGAAPKRKGQR